MDPSTILAGGRMLPVLFMDGTKADIKVRQLPIRQLALYDTLQDDEPALVELFCEQEKGWADKLTHESYEAVINTGVEINRGPFERYIQRLADRLDVVKGSRQVLIDAGHLTPVPPTQKPAKGEVLVMPEVRPAAVTPSPVVPAPTPAVPASPSMPSSDASAHGESSQPPEQ